METYQDVQRQIRRAMTIILILVPLGVLGFMVLEGLSILDSLWLTVITLATIGYGDIYAKTDAGRIFTILLIITGLSSFAYAAQATLNFVFSAEVIDQRQHRRALRRIAKLDKHYIIAGEGELVDKTINYLLRRVEMRRAYREEMVTHHLDLLFKRVFRKYNARIKPFHRALRAAYLRLHQGVSLLDAVVVITHDQRFARQLREQGLLVLEGDPSDDHVLKNAGVKKAQALIAISPHDTETLLTVLTAHSRNPDLTITASVLDHEFIYKMLRVGATMLISPYDLAGQFLNNSTFRPTVNDFFNTILFEQIRGTSQAMQLNIYEESPWVEKKLCELNLQEDYHTGVIGIRCADGNFIYTPDGNYQLSADEVLIVVAPPQFIEKIQRDCLGTAANLPHRTTWQRLPFQDFVPKLNFHHTLESAQESAKELSKHFIICAGSRVAQSAIDKLNPERSFVIISADQAQTESLLARGFRVIHGNPSQEMVLKQAGVQRALAIMISIDDKALSVLTTLTARTLNKSLLITSTAESDDMVAKLRRAGADRIISPFRIAAQFILLATTRPVINDFVQAILYNYRAGIETTEIYMQDDSPWIGKPLAELYLDRIFKAGVIGIRLASGRFLYAPPLTHVIGKEEVLIITLPMSQSDHLREIAHGNASKRPHTLRKEETRRTYSI
ncbi:MAG: NAD-binding protein [Anaerolineae bacterium]|jgi:voltage-gated potassium channel|nr:NAD-binding protein [Anaerolineae bacterium]